MIKIHIGSPFRLPRLNPDTFSKLMRAKLKYDRKSGLFEVTESTDLASVISILSNSLNSPVVIELKCSICNKDTNCYECEYSDICDRSMVSNKCICKECLNKEDAYSRYKEIFLKRLKFNEKEVGMDKV